MAFEDRAASEGERERVVAGGQAAPLLDRAGAALDDVAVAVVGGVERGWATTVGATPFAVSFWSAGSGMTARMPRERRWRRIAREE
jgi:hypothetical protein